MKTQTFLLSFQTEEGIQKDFYRFSYKKVDTCINAVKKAAAENSIFKALWNADKITKVVCYPTPDGYTKTDPVATYKLTELI